MGNRNPRRMSRFLGYLRLPWICTCTARRSAPPSFQRTGIGAPPPRTPVGAVLIKSHPNSTVEPNMPERRRHRLRLLRRTSNRSPATTADPSASCKVAPGNYQENGCFTWLPAAPIRPAG
jgi:hypothetical protein